MKLILILIVALITTVSIAAQRQSDKMVEVTITTPSVITETNLNEALANIDARLGVFVTNGITTNFILGVSTNPISIENGIITSYGSGGIIGITSNINMNSFTGVITIVNGVIINAN